MTIFDPRLYSIQVGCRTDIKIVGSQLSGVVTPGSTTFQETFSLQELPLRAEGPDTEILPCPRCGEAAFEIERSRGLLLAWSACDAPLRAWIEQKFKAEPQQRWLEPVIVLVLLALAAVLTWQVCRVWDFLAAGHTWSEFWESAVSDAVVWGGFAAFFLIAFFPAIVIVLGGGVKSTLSEFESLKPETIFWIPLSVGAPIENHPGLATFVSDLAKPAKAGDKVKASHTFFPDGRRVENALGLYRIAELRQAKIDWSFAYGMPHKCFHGPVQRV